MTLNYHCIWELKGEKNMASSVNTRRIPSDPFKRTDSSIHKMIKNNECVYDVHTHIFNKNYLPKKFYMLRLPWRERAYLRFARRLRRLSPHSDDEHVEQVARFFELLGCNEMRKVHRYNQGFYDNETTIHCPLMMDFSAAYPERLKPRRSLLEQMDEMEKLTEVFLRLLPFVAIDPHHGMNRQQILNGGEINNDCLEIFNEAFAERRSFFGIKIYPSLGYLPSDPTLMKIFEICERKNIPVTAHCGSGMVHHRHHLFRDIRGLTVNEAGELEEKVWEYVALGGPKRFTRFFNDPDNWRPVLTRFPKLRLNLAHFGAAAEWKLLLKGHTDAWPVKIAGLMKDFPNVYSDISCTLAFSGMHSYLRSWMEDNEVVYRRTLYGSDMFLTMLLGRFDTIMERFFLDMGEELADVLFRNNPRSFLFGLSDDI